MLRNNYPNGREHLTNLSNNTSLEFDIFFSYYKHNEVSQKLKRLALLEHKLETKNSLDNLKRKELKYLRQYEDELKNWHNARISQTSDCVDMDPKLTLKIRFNP